MITYINPLNINKDTTFKHNNLSVKLSKSKNNLFSITNKNETFSFLFGFKTPNTITYNYEIYLEKIESVKNLITICQLCKDLLSGNFKINDETILKYKLSNKNKRDLQTISYLIEYWSKIYELEQILKLDFIPKKILNDTMFNINFNRLYKSLVLNEAYKLNNIKLDNLSATFERSITDNDLIKMKSISDNFKLINEEKIFLGGNPVPVFIATGIFNLTIDHVELIDSNKNHYLLFPDKNNSKTYISEKIFLKHNDANNYLCNKNSMQELALAKPLM